MDRNTAVVGWQLRWIHELLFSLNLAWMVIWYERLRRAELLYRLPIGRYVYERMHFLEPETVITQVCWSIIVGVSVFVLFRLFSRFWLTGVVIRTFAGVLAVAGFPFFALTGRLAYFEPLRIQAYSPFLVFETLVVLLCASLYYFRKWPLPPRLGVALLFLHFSLWAWLADTWVSPVQEISGYGLGSLGIWVSTLFHFGFPLWGFLSSLAWARYLKSDQSPRMLTIPSQGVSHL